MSYLSVRWSAFAAICLLIAASGAAGTRHALTDADYVRAEAFMPYNTAPLVQHAVSAVTWFDNREFSYRTTTARGSEFVLVDPAHSTSHAAFDQVRLAAGLSAATRVQYDAWHLPFESFTLSKSGATVSFDIGSWHWSCDTRSYRCSAVKPADPYEALSPNGELAAFIRLDNLWVHNLLSGKQTQLTFDGVKNFGYATDNAGWRHSKRAIVSWSPDSRRIATYQQDQRGVADMYLVRTQVGHPVLETWKYAMPGDKVVPRIERVVIDVAARKVVRLQMPPDQRRTAHCYDFACGPHGSMTDVQWSPDGRHLAFVSVSRDHQIAWLRIADAVTGAVRNVIRERVGAYYESATGWAQDAVNWRYLPRNHQLIWFSQRDNWGHLCLYDARTGRLENAITTGKWNVVELLRVESKQRLLYVLGAGREPRSNPYFTYLYKVHFDGSHLQLLTPETANHVVSIDPSGRYFVDMYSTPDSAPVTVLRDSSGRLIRTLERADVSRLRALGWKPPVPIVVKARDGVTDLYGLLFRPTDFHPDRKYPLIDRVYPGPQIGSVGDWSFEPARGDAQSIAELGFIVVAIDGMGTSMRSERFQDAYYGELSDNTLPDQVAGIRELARRYPWIDLGRVGVLGHSGGAYAAAGAMFRYPDLFKVGVAESGNYDQRGYEADWGEQYIGLLRRDPNGDSNYDHQDDQRLAANLKGHLLLVQGTTDDNVPPYLTLVLAQTLIDDNKDFDMLMLPNQKHMYRGKARLYAARRRWDYFVRYLLGAQPPIEYELHPPAGAAMGTGW